jgi:hypothetical protein
MNIREYFRLMMIYFFIFNLLMASIIIISQGNDIVALELFLIFILGWIASKINDYG